jgi:hypothetical protein
MPKSQQAWVKIPASSDKAAADEAVLDNVHEKTENPR